MVSLISQRHCLTALSCWAVSVSSSEFEYRNKNYSYLKCLAVIVTLKRAKLYAKKRANAAIVTLKSFKRQTHRQTDVRLLSFSLYSTRNYGTRLRAGPNYDNHVNMMVDCMWMIISLTVDLGICRRELLLHRLAQPRKKVSNSIIILVVV